MGNLRKLVNAEQRMEQLEKEYRVYWIESWDVPDEISVDSIDEWMEQEELSEDADDFITIAEDAGNVTTLKRFVFDVNAGNFYPSEDMYIFITNKY